MKPILCIMVAAALLAFGPLSHARGTPSSSFVPRGPEPHSSLSDKHHTIKNKRAVSNSAPHQSVRAIPKAGNRAVHTSNSN